MAWLLNRTRLGVRAGVAGFLCILMGHSLMVYSAPAAESAAVQAGNGKRFATVWRIRGEVTVSDSDTGKKRILREGDPVFVGEHVHTAPLAEAVLKTEDAGIVAIRPSTEFIAEHFAAEDKPTDNFTLRLITGSLRVISGWIAHTNRAAHQIITPSATIGIRGTDHEPYVLSAELAAATSNREGTYDKVNRGGTTMQVGEKKLDIDPGKVGFVRAPGKPMKSRSLMTILLPVLLDKVPNFYVPGQFDAELDLYSKTADEESLRQLEQKRKASGAAAKAKCLPASIAKAWLAQLDGAVSQNDAQTIIAMFAPEAAIKAVVRDNDGKMVSIDLGRDELAQSALDAMKGLKDFKQRRVWTKAKLEKSATAISCDRISLRSVVVEQGRQSGKPYRFESLEEYVLELRDEKWLAIRAQTTQQ